MGRDPDRTTAVSAHSDRYDAAGDSSGRPAAGTARGQFRIPWIERIAGGAGFGRERGAQFRRGAAPEENETGLAPAADDFRVRVRHEAFCQPAAGFLHHPGRLWTDVLQQGRNAGKRGGFRQSGQASFRFVGNRANQEIQLRIQSVDGGTGQFDEFGGRNFALANQRSQRQAVMAAIVIQIHVPFHVPEGSSRCRA